MLFGHVAKSGLCSHNPSFLCVYFWQTFGKTDLDMALPEIVSMAFSITGLEDMTELFGSKRFRFCIRNLDGRDVYGTNQCESPDFFL